MFKHTYLSKWLLKISIDKPLSLHMAVNQKDKTILKTGIRYSHIFYTCFLISICEPKTLRQRQDKEQMKNENLNVKCIYLVPYKIFINHENLCQVTLAGEKPEEVCSLEPQQVGQAT